MNSNTQQQPKPHAGECLESIDSGAIWTLLRATSRTFALSIEGLPEGLREEIAVAYLLLDPRVQFDLVGASKQEQLYAPPLVQQQAQLTELLR